MYVAALTHVKSSNVACVRLSFDGVHGNISEVMSNMKRT